VGSFFPPLMAVVTSWFDRRRALAVSLAFPPFAQRPRAAIQAA
jgi:hypothetical protein